MASDHTTPHGDTAALRPGASYAPGASPDFAPGQGAERNHLLHLLAPEDYQRVRPALTPEELRFEQVLVEPGVPIRDVHFPRSGVASVISELASSPIEVGTVGREGFVGLALLLGVEVVPQRTIVQVSGDAWRMDADDFRRVLDERPAVRRLLLRYAQYFIDFLAQSVACNRLHPLEQRCARWLCMTHERASGDSFEITHEFLSMMLGVRRAGVSTAMNALQKEGVVSYRRGRVSVRDRARLEAASCPCYGVTRASYERLIG